MDVSFTNIRLLVLDFDGVIVDSEGTKRTAWPMLFASVKDPQGFSWSEHDTERLIEEAHVAWVYGTAKGSRYEIIEHIMDAVGYPKSKMMIDWYANGFDALIQKAILERGVSTEERGALETLASMLPLYLNSATPEEALKRSVETLGITSMFREVLGKTIEKRDRSKLENLAIAAGKESARPDETLFIGDAESDYRAAREFGAAFIRFAKFEYGRDKQWEQKAPLVIKSLAGLVPLLQK